MNVIEIYINTDFTLDELAEFIAERLKPVLYEQRDGENRGGIYYQFNGFGLEMELLRNFGELEITERSDYGYYAVMYSKTKNIELARLKELGEYVSDMLRDENIQTVVDCLS